MLACSLGCSLPQPPLPPSPHRPKFKAGLQAYADGVNHFLATRPLPPEYGVLETTQVDPWTPLDSVAIGKLIAFSLQIAR
jgi:penicillin G amidase